jgi:polygalacturonase
MHNAASILLVLVAVGCHASGLECLISDFVPDPAHATAGIQAAVNRCSSTPSGGTVIFDVSNINYSTGSIFITGSNIHVNIPSETVRLLAGIYKEDYPGPQKYWYVLNFNECHNCSLSGAGIIDGRARDYITGYLFDRAVLRNFKDKSCFNPWECRPRMLGIVNSTDVAVSGSIQIVDPIYWTVHVIGSKKVQLQGLKIQGQWQVFNNDGIDIDSSEDVDIVGCHIDTADDALCIKTTLRNTPMARLSVKNCKLRSRAAAIKIGSESVSDLSDMVFENIDVYNSHRGLAIQLRDKGNVSNVLFKNISASLHHEELAWWGASEILYVTAEPRFKGRKVGYVRNITFQDITAESENGVFIDGGRLPKEAVVSSYSSLPKSTARSLPVKTQGVQTTNVVKDPHVIGVRISNVDLLLRNATSFQGGYQDYRPSQERGVQFSGGTAAVWVEGARNILLEDVNVRYVPPKRSDWTEVIHIDEDSVENLEFEGCSFGQRPSD